MISIGVLLEPIDALFFRGSRVSQSGLPHPQTVAGAIRTALLHAHGFDLRSVKGTRHREPGRPMRELLLESGAPRGVVDAQLLGPLLARRQAGVWSPLFSAPRTLVRAKGERSRIKRVWPIADGGASRFLAKHVKLPSPGALPIWSGTPGDLEPIGGYVTSDGMRQFLEGGAPKNNQVIEADDLYAFDSRTGVAIGIDSMTAEDGKLYTESLLTLAPGVAIYVEARADRDVFERIQGEPVRLGGQGRCAVLELTSPLLEALQTTPANGDRGRVLVLITPGRLAHGSIPSLSGVELRAASVGKPILHSGFDVVRGGPRPTRRLAAAGSVYFVDRAPESRSLAATEEECAQGEAAYLVGRWISGGSRDGE